MITTNTVTPSTTGADGHALPLYVNNTGSINDSFNLAVGPLTPVPAGWSVVFRADGGARRLLDGRREPHHTGTINAGANRLICAEVTVPVTTSGQAARGQPRTSTSRRPPRSTARSPT